MDAKMKALGKTGFITYCPQMEMWRLGGLCNIKRCHKSTNACEGTNYQCTDTAGPVEDFISKVLLKYMEEGRIPDRETDEIGHGDDEIKAEFVNGN